MSLEALLSTFNLSKSQVTPTEKLLLLACARRAGETHECWPSIERLCIDTGFDRKTVIKLRKSVITKKLMVCDDKFMRGKTGQIPIMRLTYVNNFTVDKSFISVDNSENCQLNNTKIGTVEALNSPNSGTGNSTTIGTQKRKEESINNKRANTTTSVDQQGQQEKNKMRSGLTYIDDNFQPDDLTLKKLHEMAEIKKIDTVELQKKFIEVSKRYKTRSENWQKTFVDFLERERPREKMIFKRV